MERYVLALVLSNNARRQERNINYVPERVRILEFDFGVLLFHGCIVVS